MRFLNKYKTHENRAASPLKLPVRVLKFKRTKWQKIKNKLKLRFIWTNISKKIFKRKNKKKLFKIILKRKKINKDKQYFDYLKTYVPIVRKVYCRNMPKLKYQTKKTLQSMFDNSIKFKSTNTAKFKNEFISANIFKHILRVDLFLWYLKFATSSWSVRQLINSGYVFVNNKQIKLNYYLKKGDIIHFNFPVNFEMQSKYNVINKKFRKRRYLLPFLEYDYYTNSFILLRDMKDFSKEDFAFIIIRVPGLIRHLALLYSK